MEILFIYIFFEMVGIIQIGASTIGNRILVCREFFYRKFNRTSSSQTHTALNPRTYTSKVTPPPPWYKGGRGWWTPLGFRYVTIFWKDFPFGGKPAFDVLYKMRYILGVTTLLGGLWRHSRWPPFWAPSWILSKSRNCQKTLNVRNIRCWTCRI